MTMNAYDNNPDHIEEEIARTRQRIDSRLNDLSEQTAPDTLLREAVGAKSASTTDIIDATLRSARENPLSALLFGVGLAGLALGKARREPELPRRYVPMSDDPAERIAARTNHLRNEAARARSEFDEGIDRAAGAVTAAGSKASNAAESATDAASNGKDTLADSAEEAHRQTVGSYKIARNHVAHAARELPEKTAEAAIETGSWMKDNPLPTGLMALAIGAAAASILTGTRSRNRSEDDHRGPPPLPADRSPVTAEGDLPTPAPAARKGARKKPKATAASKKKSTTAKTRAAATRTAKVGTAAKSKATAKPRPKAGTPAKGGSRTPQTPGNIPKPSKKAQKAIEQSTSVQGEQTE